MTENELFLKTRKKVLFVLEYGNELSVSDKLLINGIIWRAIASGVIQKKDGNEVTAIVDALSIELESYGFNLEMLIQRWYLDTYDYIYRDDITDAEKVRLARLGLYQLRALEMRRMNYYRNASRS